MPPGPAWFTDQGQAGLCTAARTHARACPGCAAGILNVAAVDKGSGKSEKITITNDKGEGRLAFAAGV